MIGEVEAISKDEPFAFEKLSPILAMYRAKDFQLVSLFIRARQNRKNRVTLHKGFKKPKFGARIIHDTNGYW